MNAELQHALAEAVTVLGQAVAGTLPLAGLLVVVWMLVRTDGKK